MQHDLLTPLLRFSFQNTAPVLPFSISAKSELCSVIITGPNTGGNSATRKVCGSDAITKRLKWLLNITSGSFWMRK